MIELGKTWADLDSTPREVSWRALRSLRADPPGFAGGERQATFTMALEQAEQLFAAAIATGPAARPLLLFYGLSQAGRALVAARTSSDLWQVRGHGISEAKGNSSIASIAEFKVEPRASTAGALSLVATALGSSTLPGPTRLGDLWPLLPDTQRFKLPGSGIYRLLNIRVQTYRMDMDPINAEISGLPGSLGIERAVDEDASQPRSDWREEEKRVNEFLRSYPSLRGYKFGTGGGQPIGFRVTEEETGIIAVHWPNGSSTASTPDELRREVATGYAGHTNVYPCLDGSCRPLHPFVIWWALLFGLSILARYEPEAWGRAIDINGAREAVAIEHILNAAIDSIPELIYRTLTEEA